jgi:ribosomal protein L14
MGSICLPGIFQRLNIGHLMSSGLLPRGRGSSLFTDIQTQTLTVSGSADINFLHVTTLEADSANIGALTVATINGSPVPPGGFGDVIGPASATDNAVARYDGITGKLIQNSVVLIDDLGAITGVTTINGDPIGNVDGPVSSTDNAITRWDGATGRLVQNSVVLISDAGAITGVTTLNGSAIPSPIGDVVGPASATDNAVARYDATTGKLIQNSVVLIGDTGAITGIAALNGAPVPTGTNTGNVTLAAFGAAPNANAATLSGATGQVLTLQPASATFPGGVSTVAQSFLGTKFFTNGIQLNALQVGGETNTLSFFETTQPLASFTQWSGPFAVNPTPTRAWSWDKIGPRGFLDLAGFQFAANLLSPAIITSVSALPVYMRPPVGRIMNIQVVNGSTVVDGTIIVNSNGIVQIGVGNASTGGTLTGANNFGILGNNGTMPWQVHYVI